MIKTANYSLNCLNNSSIFNIKLISESKLYFMVRLVGNAPTTSSMSMRHSTFELKAPNKSLINNIYQ
jgi:hypothetical protein